MKKIIAILAVAVSLASCSKDVKDLPAASDTGSNTFGASVNGTLWAPKGFGIVPTTPILEAHYTPGRSIVINARNFASEPKESEFEIQLKNVTQTGTYVLNDQTGNYAYYEERKITPTGQWRTNNEYPGTVNITRTDTVNKIVSGTFEFRAASLFGGAPLTVTDGRFDIKLE